MPQNCETHECHAVKRTSLQTMAFDSGLRLEAPGPPPKPPTIRWALFLQPALASIPLARDRGSLANKLLRNRRNSRNLRKSSAPVANAPVLVRQFAPWSSCACLHALPWWCCGFVAHKVYSSLTDRPRALRQWIITLSNGQRHSPARNRANSEQNPQTDLHNEWKEMETVADCAELIFGQAEGRGTVWNRQSHLFAFACCQASSTFSIVHFTKWPTFTESLLVHYDGCCIRR